MVFENKIFYLSLGLFSWIALYYIVTYFLLHFGNKKNNINSSIALDENNAKSSKNKNYSTLINSEKTKKTQRKMPIMQTKEKDRIIMYWWKWLIVGVFVIYIWLISPYIKNYLYNKWLNPLWIVFEWKMIFMVIGFSLIGWVANVFHNIYVWIKNANNFNIILEHESLFKNKEQFNLILTQSLLGRYDKNWNMWIEVQPILSTLVWVVVYFIIKSWIHLSWSTPTDNPSVFFYWWIAFLCWFFYEKFLDFLQKISNQIINTDWPNESVINKINEFEILKKSILKDTQIKTDKIKNK